MPLAPLPKFVIGQGPQPDYKGYSYYETGRDRLDYDTLYALPNIDRFTFAHEMGHVFDEKLLRPEHRELLKKWLKIKGPWFWGDMPHGPFDEVEGEDAGMETFANAYAEAATGMFAKRVRLRRFLKKVAREYER